MKNKNCQYCKDFENCRLRRAIDKQDPLKCPVDRLLREKEKEKEREDLSIFDFWK